MIRTGEARPKTVPSLDLWPKLDGALCARIQYLGQKFCRASHLGVLRGLLSEQLPLQIGPVDDILS